ncbi:MAG: GAF domain-containing sensor histidine kinase [bacterium]|nr:GAF domain-containing sensor histidine kinase [bacterium]
MPTSDTDQAHLQEVNEEMYKRNIELAVVNNTLSLLRKLYQISLLSLNPISLSEKISETVRVDLNMETVGVFYYNNEEDILFPYAMSESDRMVETLQSLHLRLSNLFVKTAKTNPITHGLITEKKPQILTEINGLWDIPSESLLEIGEKSHVKTVLLYPLLTQDTVIGMLFLALNRSYDLLNNFEQNAIKSIPDVVAVALDKALLYEELKVANEKLQALDKARAEFISIASHQLRTPPATIKWYLGSVIGGDFGALTEELKAAIDRARVANDSQIATIDDLLNASRIERGKLEFFFEKAPLEPIVSLLAEQLQPLAQMKKLALEYIKPSGVIPEIVMDKEKVRQVINNMIDNAIKYSKTGTIKVALKFNADNATVSVTDNGKGIPAGVSETLFQKYSRGKDSATQATGLGLGLYVAKVIVEQHNGKIWAESPGEGKGSTFAFSLPINNAVEPTSVDLTLSQ